MVKPRFTLEKHYEVAFKLKKIIQEYSEIRLEIANSFPRNAPVAKEANKARNPYTELRNQLDNEFYKLEGTEKLKSPYYGSQE